ncbi:hypothetical protein ACET3Z_018607 [Daucus carota]
MVNEADLPTTFIHLLFLWKLRACIQLHRLLVLVVWFAVGPSSMPCQLMVGFFAYAKSLEIYVDKEELEGK